jgi:hypothetical protein
MLFAPLSLGVEIPPRRVCQSGGWYVILGAEYQNFFVCYLQTYLFHDSIHAACDNRHFNISLLRLFPFCYVFWSFILGKISRLQKNIFLQKKISRLMAGVKGNSLLNGII